MHGATVHHQAERHRGPTHLLVGRLFLLLLGIPLLAVALWIAYLRWSQQDPASSLAQDTTGVMPPKTQNGYTADPPPKPPPGAPVDDPTAEALRALQRQLAQLQNDMQALKQRPAATPPPAPAKEAPKPRPHRPMGYMAFEVPTEPVLEEPRYTLAAWDTVIPCTVKTKTNSDVESVATALVTTNIYDTADRRHILIPQGSTIGVRYYSANLVYGDQRLSMSSAAVTLPNGTVIPLDEEPLMTQEGTAGLVTRVNNHYWRALPAVLIQGVLRGSVAAVNTTTPYAAGMASSAAQYGNTVTQRYINLRPTIEIEPGEGCVAILTKSLELPTYREKHL